MRSGSLKVMPEPSSEPRLKGRVVENDEIVRDFWNRMKFLWSDPAWGEFQAVTNLLFGF